MKILIFISRKFKIEEYYNNKGNFLVISDYIIIVIIRVIDTILKIN